MDFEEYQNGRFRHIHNNTVILLWVGSLITFIAEFSLFLITLKNNHFPQTPQIYFLKRIVCPSGINIIASLVVTLVTRSQTVSIKRKNYICSFAVLICVTSISSFHTYFAIMMASVCFALFNAVLYADKKLFFSIVIGVFVCYLIVSCSFFFECHYFITVDKIMTFICYTLVILIAIFFARVILNEQIRQLDYIYTNYLRQTTLIEELKLEPMTHLYNKACMEDCLDSIIRNYEERTPCAIAMIDIDHFKRINDKYGHEAGDTVLLKLSALMKKHVASTKNCFRFGGEEFVITFHNMDRNEIEKIISAMNNELKETRFDFAPKEIISFTTGIAFVDKSMNRSKWFNCADEAMYRGKQSGRDKIIFYDDLVKS